MHYYTTLHCAIASRIICSTRTPPVANYCTQATFFPLPKYCALSIALRCISLCILHCKKYAKLQCMHAHQLPIIANALLFFLTKVLSIEHCIALRIALHWELHCIEHCIAFLLCKICSALTLTSCQLLHPRYFFPLPKFSLQLRFFLPAQRMLNCGDDIDDMIKMNIMITLSLITWLWWWYWWHWCHGLVS